MKVVIITAMQSEYDAVHKLYDFNEKGEAEVYNKQLLLIKSGMGKVNGALAAEKAYNMGANLIINTGLAGGIDSSLDQGDIVLADRVCYHDVWCGEPNAKGQVQDMPLYYTVPTKMINVIKAQAPDFRVGLTVTGDQFLTDIHRLQEIKETFKESLAVDMESAAIAQACYLNKIPFISLRIISDVVGKVGQEEQYKNFWQQVPNKAADMIDRALKAIPAD